MASSITRFDIEKLDGNIESMYKIKKNVFGLKWNCRDRETEDFQVSNDDTAVTQRQLEDKQPEKKTNTDCLVKEQKKVHLGGPRFEVPALDEDAEYRLCLSVTPKDRLYTTTLLKHSILKPINMSDSSGGGMSDLDDIDMIMQQLQSEKEQQEAA
ncbi:hypothetical protein Tco_0879823 [Tanacetum coccineum]